MRTVFDNVNLICCATFITVANMIWIGLCNLLVTETSFAFDIGFCLVNFVASLWLLSALNSDRTKPALSVRAKRPEHVTDVRSAHLPSH